MVSPRQFVSAGLRCIQARNVLATKPFPNTRRFQTTAAANSPLADGDLVPLRGRFDLTGKNYIVTGGGRGIGYAAVRGIAEMGGNVSILDAAPAPVRDFDSLGREFGVKTKYIRTDVASEESLTTAFSEMLADFGTLDGW